MKIIWREEALQDFKGAIQYLRDRNPNAALSASAAIRRNVRLLSDHPHLGRAGRVEGTRELVIAGTSHVVIYTVDSLAGVVVILRVLHGRMRWPRQSDEEEEPT